MGTAITLTLDGLKVLGPCDFAKRKKFFAGGAAITAAEARTAGASFDDVMWVASALAQRDADVERRVRLWLADCAARVLHIYEKQAPGDDRVRAAIIASRQFARGKITAAARAAAWDAARAAARAAAWDTAWDAARAAAWDTSWVAAWAAARAAAWDAAWDAARDTARAAAWDTAWDAARDTAWDAARAAEEQWQFDRLCAWLSADEPEDWPLSEIVTAQAA